MNSNRGEIATCLPIMAALSLELDGEWLQADTLAAFFLRPQIYRANEKLGQAAWQEAQAAAEGISLR